MVIWDFLKGIGTKSLGHFSFETFGKKPVNIMIAIIGKDKAAILHVSLKVLSLLSGKLDELMSAEVAKRTFKDLRTAELHHFFLLIHRNRGKLHQRIQQI
ncbi:MAG: hypothetical protein ACI8YP_002006 [Algoriphagus sp.]|jgi:hypothetical protein